MTASETEAAPVSDSARQRIAAWFNPGRFAALLGILIALTFIEVVTGQATFFYRDFGVFTYPVAFYQRECFWRGEFPLWNPLTTCGEPFLAQWNTSALYPLTLFYLLFPLSWSLGVFGLLHLFLGGMGMYFLARRWTGNQLAAAIAGAIFAFNGLTWQMLVWVSNLSAWAWMPWVVLAIEQAWQRPAGRSLSFAALSGAMQMLTGSPEIIFLTWCFVGALWLIELGRGKTPRWKVIVCMLGVGLLVAGLSAAQLLPFLDLLRASNRNANFGDLGWAMPLSGPANFLVPLFRCFESGHGVYSQNGQYWTPSYYGSAAIVALALAAAWRVREWRVWLLSAAVLGGVLMALGPAGHFYSAVRTTVPQIGFIRYTIKFVVLAVFALPLLAAYALAHGQLPAASSSSSSSTSPDRILLAVGAIVLALIALILVVDWIRPEAYENRVVILQNGLVRVLFLALIFGVLALLRREERFQRQLLLALALLALFWGDIYLHAPKINPTVQRAVYEAGFMRRQFGLGPAHWGEPRFMPTLAAQQKATSTYLPDPLDEYLCRRLALYENCNLLDAIPKTDGFFSSHLKESDQVLALLLDEDAKGEPTQGFKDFLGIGHITAPEKVSHGGLDWTNRAMPEPLITAGRRPVFADGPGTGKGLFSVEFDPRHTVYLAEGAKPFIRATNEVPVKLQFGKLAAQKLEFEAEAPSAALVTVAQAYYHNWHAYVDGQETTLWRANYAFQAIEVPAGKHRVSLVYVDGAFRRGLVISAVCLVICGGLFFWRAKRLARAGVVRRFTFV